MEPKYFRDIARQNLSGRWLISVLVCFISLLLGGLNSNTSIKYDSNEQKILKYLMDSYDWLRPIIESFLVFTVIALLISFFVGSVIELGTKKYFIKQYDGQEHGVNDLFSQFPNYGGAFLLRLFTILLLFLWTLLFIIPGIIKSYSYAMAPYIMAEHPELRPDECITRSRELMHGHKFELFCLQLSFIGWIILCIFTLGIGFFFLRPYQQAATAAFYRNLCPAEVVNMDAK